MKVDSSDPLDPVSLDNTGNNSPGQLKKEQGRPGGGAAEGGGIMRGGSAWGFLNTGHRAGGGLPTAPDPGAAVRVRVAMTVSPLTKADGSVPSGIASVPDSPQTAPSHLHLGAEVNARMQKLTAESLAASQQHLAVFGVNGQEYGGAICATPDGKLHQPNTQIGAEAGRLRMDLKGVPEGCKVTGFFHTHFVMDPNEQHGYTFSGTDFITFVEKKELNVFVVQSKNGEQFALLRTKDTPASIEGKDFENLYKRYLLRVGKLQFQKGMPYSKALQIAASEMAKYGTKMVYYEGRDGVFERFDKEEPDAKTYWEAPYRD